MNTWDQIVEEKVQHYRDADERRADALLHGQAGPWRVTSKVLNRYRVEHERDKSSRLLSAVDLIRLFDAAGKNGHTAVLAREPAPERPIQSAPLYARGGTPT